MQKYLMAHFTGESPTGEQIYLAISEGGKEWKELNDGHYVLASNVGEKGLRDPYIIYSPLDSYYYVLVTDLRIANGKGWDVAQGSGSTKMAVTRTKDFVHWDEITLHDLAPENAGCLWAPKAIFDEEKQAFMIVFASRINEADGRLSQQKIYCTYTKDFVDYTQAELYFEKEDHVIDMIIIKEKGTYYRFYKDETSKHICLDYGDSLDGIFEKAENKTLEKLYGVEGPAVYFDVDESKWCLLVDQYSAGKGYLPLTFETFLQSTYEVNLESTYDFGKTIKRHGSIIPITDEIYGSLKEIDKVNGAK